jgi:L-fuconolactonase
MSGATASALIDAHVHVWDPTELAYSWLAGTEVERPMLPGEYLADAPETTGAIFVQAADDTVDPVAEARWVDGLPWPGLLAIVAGADLAAPEARVSAQLAALAAVPRVAGVRHLLQDLPVSTFPALLPGLRLLQDAGGTFDACIRHHQLTALRELLEPVPELVVVLDHIGKPPIDEGVESPAGAEWARAITHLAERSHTFVKLSGVAPESGDRAAYERNVGPFLRHAWAAFGSDRAMFAGDWPVSTTFGVGGTVPEWVERVRAVVPAAEWPAVAAGTARAAYLTGGRPRLAAGA